MDFDKRAPIHLALEEGEESIVELLLQKGADPNAPSQDLISCLHYCATRYACFDFKAGCKADMQGATPWCEKGRGLPLRCKVLVKRGPHHLSWRLAPFLVFTAAVTPPREECLHEAVYLWGPIRLLHLFLEKGGNVHAANEEGWTPLHLSCRCDRASAILCPARPSSAQVPNLIQPSAHTLHCRSGKADRAAALIQ
eukprot:1154299-Pelagomonas_calceolata.AAC.1